MVLSPERLLAYVARVGSLVRVGPLVYQQIVTLGELSVAESAYELFFGSGRPADADGGTRGRCRCPRSVGRRRRCRRRAERGRTRDRPAEQRRRRLTTVLAAGVQQEWVRVPALVHDRLQHLVFVQGHCHQLVLLLLV